MTQPHNMMKEWSFHEVHSGFDSCAETISCHCFFSGFFPLKRSAYISINKILALCYSLVCSCLFSGFRLFTGSYRFTQLNTKLQALHLAVNKVSSKIRTLTSSSHLPCASSSRPVCSTANGASQWQRGTIHSQPCWKPRF